MEGEKKIDKYQFSLSKLIGQGSYANVYMGKEISTGMKVAVKVIDKKIFLNAYNLKNIQSEIDIMKMVQHDSIVKLFDIYQTTNNMYIVTEFCHDGDLFNLLKKKRRIHEKTAIKYLKDIMAGLEYLHENGIIHRDLKPANILLKGGTCKISDFGFAKNLENEDSVMKSIVGTPLYMSPQILQRKKYTTKSDLWSLGLIFYEMIHGKTPWPASNELQLINGIYNKKMNFSREISERSKKFIRECLQIEEESRLNWDQAFNHELFKEESAIKGRPRPSEDKENIDINLLKQKAPNFNSKGISPGVSNIKNPKNQDSNGTALKLKDQKLCFTPKRSAINKKANINLALKGDSCSSNLSAKCLSKSPKALTGRKQISSNKISVNGAAKGKTKDSRSGLKSNLSNLGENSSHADLAGKSKGGCRIGTVLTPTKRHTPIKVPK